MDAPWKVGELARRTGVTVRTLHHYDEVGLLRPSGRTPAGHRLYGPAEVRRLQQIVSLRRLGLSLDEIASLLGGGDGLTLAEVVELQVERLREEIRERTRLLELLEELGERLEGDGAPDPDELTRTIAETVRTERWFSPEQLRALAERRRSLGADGMARGERAWRELLEDWTDALERGVPPGAPEALDLARRGRELVRAFTGGDPGLDASLATLYREEGGEAVLARRGMPLAPGVWAYMAEAGKALARAEGDGAGVDGPGRS